MLMSTGILRVSTFDVRQSAPVPNAEIRVTGEGLDRTFTTDGNGLSPDLSIPAPDKKYSLEESNTTVQPWSSVDLVARAPGYEELTMTGIQIFDGQVTLAQLELTPRMGRAGGEPQKVEIPPHSLFVGGGGSGPAPTFTEEEENARVLQKVIIPKSITVHLGAPSSSARNVTVSFKSYIANVASSEVYPTWAGASIPTF